MSALSIYTPYAARRRRLVCLAASAGTTAIVFSSLLGLFDSAGQTPWLAPTPELAQLLAACDTADSSSARHACVRKVVASTTSREAQATRIAAAKP